MSSPIRPWVEEVFHRRPGRKMFIEAGANDGSDTRWMAAIPGVQMHCFEPDMRNTPPDLPNVTLHRKAIAAHDGTSDFILSQRHPVPRLTAASSSIRAPKNHLQVHPDVTFGPWIEVECIRLDTFTQEQGIDIVDFLWADVQGAEGDLIDGGLKTLSRTRWFFTEYSDEELYDCQINLAEILRRLPGFKLIAKWRDDVLLANTRLT